MKLLKLSTLFLFVSSFSAIADTTVKLNFVGSDAAHQPAGTVRLHQTAKGLLLTPHLKGLTPGIRGFHIHEKPSCAKGGMAAGEHFDPAKTKKHLGPYGKGHLGDLPALKVDANGNANIAVLAPHIHSIKSIEHRALMVHNGGDNYSDRPEKAGGGDGRMACGIIK